MCVLQSFSTESGYGHHVLECIQKSVENLLCIHCKEFTAVGILETYLSSVPFAHAFVDLVGRISVNLATAIRTYRSKDFSLLAWPISDKMVSVV